MKILYALLWFVAVTSIHSASIAQTVATGFTNNNGSGTITFNLQNTNSYDVVITGIEGAVGSSGVTTAGMWYKTTPVSGSPGAISSANGWNQVATGTFNGVAVTSGTSTQTFLSNLTFILPANTTYGMAVCAYVGTSARQRYSTLAAGSYVATTAGVKILSGTNISYGSGVPPTAPSIANRGWIGKIHFMPACENPSGLAANNVTTTDADISWSPVIGSLGYEYVLNQTAASPAGSGISTTTTTHHASGLTINTQYYFHIRNKCSNTFSSWTNFPFMTADAYCKPPLNVLYSNITTTSADVLWSMMPTSDHYEYLYDMTSGIIPNSQNAVSTNAITANLAGLQPETKYYFFVRSICLGGADSSTWRLDSFTTKAGCGSPDVKVNNGGTTTPDASWDPIPNAVAYEYRVTSSTTPPAFGDELTTTSVSLTLPEDLSDQYLHVRSKCNSQFTFSPWATRTMRQVPAGIYNTSAIKPSVYPNPVGDYLYVKDAKGAQLILTDIRGSILLKMNVNESPAIIPMSDFTPGVYVLKTLNGGLNTHQLLKKN